MIQPSFQTRLARYAMRYTTVIEFVTHCHPCPVHHIEETIDNIYYIECNSMVPTSARTLLPDAHLTTAMGIRTQEKTL